MDQFNQATRTHSPSQSCPASIVQLDTNGRLSTQQLADKTLECEASCLIASGLVLKSDGSKLALSMPSTTTIGDEKLPFVLSPISPLSPLPTSPIPLLGEPPEHFSLILTSIINDAYPEGGLQAWLVVFGAWCGMFASLGIGSTLATFQTQISENQMVAIFPGRDWMDLFYLRFLNFWMRDINWFAV